MTKPFLVQMSTDGGKTWADTCMEISNEKLATDAVDSFNRTDREKRKYRVALNRGEIDKKTKQ